MAAAFAKLATTVANGVSGLRGAAATASSRVTAGLKPSPGRDRVGAMSDGAQLGLAAGAVAVGAGGLASAAGAAAGDNNTSPTDAVGGQPGSFNWVVCGIVAAVVCVLSIFLAIIAMAMM